MRARRGCSAHVESRSVLRCLFLAGTALLPLRALASALGSDDPNAVPSSLASLLLDVPVLYFLFREVRALMHPPEARPGVVVLAPEPADGFALGIQWIRVVVGGLLASLAYTIADGSWVALIGATGDVSPLLQVAAQLLLGFLVLPLGLALALGENRTEVHPDALVVTGRPHGEPVPFSIFFSWPALARYLLAYLVPRRIARAEAQRVTVDLYAYQRAGVVHRFYTPVLVLRDGTKLRAGLTQGHPDPAAQRAQAAAQRTGLPYAPGGASVLVRADGSIGASPGRPLGHA